ncbi:MAG: hypothetical protein AAB869_00125 [Patescibacteria group bacterium]
MSANLSFGLEDLWVRFKAAEKVVDRQNIMGEIIKRLLIDGITQKAIDVALVECTARQPLFELGMSIVMAADRELREAFRRRLVEYGAAFQVRRLARLMERPLSRDEVVMLGNRYTGGLVFPEEISRFLSEAETIVGITELDLRRLRKQFDPERKIPKTI